jgi:hypothetical protein
VLTLWIIYYYAHIFYSKSSLEVTCDLYVAGCIVALDVEHYQEFCAKEGKSETLNE